MKLYLFFRKILKGFFFGLFRIEVNGVDNISVQGPLIVCSNHVSNWDPIILAVVSRRQIRFMAKHTLFKIPVLRKLLRALGAFPVNRQTADLTAIKTSIAYLKDGEAVGIFPQGKRYRGIDPWQTKVKSGVGMIAYRSKADVIPILIRTNENVIKPFRKVRVDIGNIIRNNELGIENGTQAEYSNGARYIFDKILELGKEKDESNN